VEAFDLSQAVTDKVDVLLWGGDAPFRFFLEGVQDVDGLPKADGVDRSPCAAYLIRDDFKHSAAAKTSQRLCRWIGFTLLSGKQGLTDLAPNFAGETAQVSPA
jgi:hypothetical protein